MLLARAQSASARSAVPANGLRISCRASMPFLQSQSHQHHIRLFSLDQNQY
jgi:hypothetical protein